MIIIAYINRILAFNEELSYRRHCVLVQENCIRESEGRKSIIPILYFLIIASHRNDATGLPRKNSFDFVEAKTALN